MHLSRRTFTGGALGLALGSQYGVPALAQRRPELGAALAAIRAYGEAHVAFNHLPGMTLGLVTPDGRRAIMNFGYANAEARSPITPDMLFQIGSISKVMVAAVLHQFAVEGRLRLTDRLSDLLPAIPLPAGNAIQVQHLLDHVAGLAGDAPLFPDGGLWTAYAPGQHWHYSNTAYEILGKLAEHLGQKPLAELLRERIFAPLAMRRSRGAIIGADRTLYAQGYEAADMVAVYARGVPLAPAPWVDVTAGAGCVASTADDMLSFLQTLAAAVQDRGGLALAPDQARAFTTHAVPSDTPGMGYGNGLMHVGEAGRSYFHHTGGMLSFSSSFHVDIASGAGAFASSTLNAFAEYRPRLLTRFAVDALTNAVSGRPIPPPPPRETPLANAASYVGRYAGPAGAFEIRPGQPLTIVAGGEAAALEPLQDELFRTTHASFRSYSLLFERRGGRVALASYGPSTYARERSGATVPVSNAALARLAGRYINDNSWYGAARVVERGGRLWLDTGTPMTPIADNLWRVGKESWSPERGSFANFVDGRPQTFIFSGEKFLRHAV
ncbi:MAG: serine hydrolase domain-containing protein [Sphingomicrobium sp.]